MVSINQAALKELAKDYHHYYGFFKDLSTILMPKLILELGTWKGDSSASFADGYKPCQVITVNNQDELDPHNIRDNVRYLEQDSLEFVTREDIDILFIDTLHDGRRCLYEFNIHSTFVAKGGLIFFDDIHLNEEMKKFWENFNPYGFEKFELPIHGDAGMGVLIKL